MIAASAPKQNTVTDFLHMIMEHNEKLVMKVCEDKVGTREQCSKYIDGKDKLEKRDSQELAGSSMTTSTLAT